MAETIDDILRGAKAFLSKKTVLDDATEFAQSEAAARREAQNSPLKRYGKVAKDTALGAAIPASFLGGPVGMAAGGLLSLEGLKGAIDEPTALNVGMAGLGALPFVKPLKKLMSAGKTASGVNGAKAWRGVNMGGAKAASGITSDISHGTQVPSSSIDDLLASRRFANQAPELVDEIPMAQELPDAAGVEDSLAGLKRMLGGVPSSRKVQGVDRLNRMTGEAANEYRGAAQHGVSGFSGLPEMSLGELARMSENIRRFGGQ